MINFTLPTRAALLAPLVSLAALSASADDIFHDYENFTEGVIGDTFHHEGVTYHDANNVSGFFPDGEPFTPDDLGTDFIIENAGLFYNDFPGYGSPINALTFGRAFVPGDNLTIGPLASVWMTLDELGSAASLDIAFYENGPWGGIDWVLEAVRDGQVVATERYTIAGGDGRDNPTWTTLSIDGAEFDSLHLYSWLNDDYTAARGMIDDLAIRIVPAPGAFGLFGLFAVAGMIRSRRRSAEWLRSKPRL